MWDKNEKKKGRFRWERISSHKGTIFTWRFVRPSRITTRKKERKKERKKAEKTGWNQFNTCICIYTYPFLLLWSRALPALPSGRNALSARPCPGQWLSTDYAVPRRSVGDIMVTHRMQSNSPFYTIRRVKPDTRETMSNGFWNRQLNNLKVDV